MAKIAERIRSVGNKINLEGNFVSNVISTMIGIILTIGVGVWLQNRQDKQIAREMMFNIVKTAKDNGDGLVELDSICRDQQNALEYIFAYNRIYSGRLDSIPEDSLAMYCYRSFRIVGYLITRSKTENYFYNAQTMHQFNNPEVFVKFAEFVENDRHIYGLLDQLYVEAETVLRSITAKRYCERKTLAQAVEDVIQDHSLYTYYQKVRKVSQPDFIKIYRDSYKNLLKEMGATQEEFDEYVKSTEAKDEEETEEETAEETKEKTKEEPAKEAKK